MRLIDADNVNWGRCPVSGYAMKEWLAEQPTIDAVPVVRCRWCKSHHWEQEPCHGKTVHFCEKLNAEVTADFFCAAGKRKDGEG